MGEESLETIIVTGFFHRNNFGDDLFEWVYKKLLVNENVKFVTNDDLDLVTEKVSCIILAGGDVLNDYFLNKLVNRSVPIYAFSVGIPYTDIVYGNRLNIFSLISCRAKKDYNLLKKVYKDNIFYNPDLSCEIPRFVKRVDKTWFKPSKSIVVGVCLARPIANGNGDYTEIVRGIAKFIDKICMYDCHVVLIPFNTGKNEMESDLIINQHVYEKSVHKRYISVLIEKLDVDEMYTLFERDLDYVIPMRYHAYMMGIITNTPILSIGISPKVNNLLTDLKFPDYFRYKMDGGDVPCKFDPDIAIEKFKTLVKQKNELQIIYKNYQTCYNSSSMLQDCIKKPESRQMINKVGQVLQNIGCDVLEYILSRPPTESEIESLLTQPGYISKVTTQEHSSEFLAALICFKLVNIPFPKYHYGMSQKIKSASFDFKSQVTWVLKDAQSGDNDTKFNETNITPLFNATYVGIEDFKGCHRSGWQYVLNGIKQYHDTSCKLIFDNYVDRTFHWAEKIYSYCGLIPFNQPWCGFIHHTFDCTFTKYCVPNLFQVDTFISSLKHCQALFTLSKELKRNLQAILNEHGYGNIPVIDFVHPTEIPELKFDYQTFLANSTRKIVQIGAWLRNPYGIYALEPCLTGLKIRKAVLRGRNMSNSFKPDKLNITITDNCNQLKITNDKCEYSTEINKYIWGLAQYIIEKNRGVDELNTLDNEDYDKLLAENLVFLNLTDASAVNTVIECIVRCTPILVNKLPSLVEVLGDTYPFFYTSFEEANVKCNNPVLILETHRYLCSLDKTRFNIDFFVTSLANEIQGLV